MKYYENLRLVYEVQTRLQEWSDQDEKRQAGEGKKRNELRQSSGSGCHCLLQNMRKAVMPDLLKASAGNRVL